MSLPPFDVLRPVTLEEAIEALARHGPDARIVAGGTDLIPSMKQRLFTPRVLVDIKRIRDLNFIRFNRTEGLEIGSLTSLTRLAESPVVGRYFPVLGEAARAVASPLLRNMGTLGGNLCLDTRCLYYNQSLSWRQAIGGCLKKDGSVCHVAPAGQFCWAVFSGDTAAALMTLGARVRLAGPRGMRECPLAELYVNNGLAWLSKAHDEIVTGVQVPGSSSGWSGSYKKLRIRRSIDYPLAGVAAVMRKSADGTCLEARVALTAVNPAPRLVKAADLLKGRRYDRALLEEVAHDAIRTAKPLRTSASVPEYRRHMIRVFVRRALEGLWLDGGDGGPPAGRE